MGKYNKKDLRKLQPDYFEKKNILCNRAIITNINEPIDDTSLI